MKTFKINTVIAFIILMVTACSSHSQDHPGKDHRRGGHGHHRNFSPDTMAKKQTERMKQELSLSADQESKVGDINLKYAKKRKEIMDEMHKQMEAMNKENEQELRRGSKGDGVVVMG